MARGWPKGRPRGSRKIHSIEQLATVEPVVDAAPRNEAPVLAGGSPPSVREQILAGLIEPPPNYRKACDYQLDPSTMPWEIVRCRECNMEMYTRNPAKRDVCEDCMWVLTQQLAEVERVRILRNTDRLLNPFASRNPFSELSGSLPSIKK